MKSFRRRRGDSLERELRDTRPEPRPEFLAMLGERVDSARNRSYGRVRVAFGAALTAALLVAVASVGGVGYGASAAHKVAKTVIRISHTHHPRVAKNTAAANQYPRTVKVCFQGRVQEIQESDLASFQARGAKLVSASAVVGSNCALKAGAKHRKKGRPAFTG